jgi:hypothetical protein
MTNSAARDTEDGLPEPIRKAYSDPHPSGLLLLTPALRVAGSEQPEPRDRSADVPRSWSLEAQIAELEAAIGDRGDWEPDGGEEKPRHFRVRRRPISVPSKLSTSSGKGFGLSPAHLDIPPLYDENDLAAAGIDITSPERLPDPDALRDLVSEMVRAELQSELGQRVTRNVRKLVRREIRRALAARDFD